MSHHISVRRTLSTILIGMLILTLLPAALALASNPVVTTDKPDDHPGETVLISGSGFVPNADLPSA